jgi:hypothetical protein
MMTHPSNILRKTNDGSLAPTTPFLTGQRLLDLPIVQTYADIVLQSEAHIREVQTRIQAVEKECLIKKLKKKQPNESQKRKQMTEHQRQEEEQR